MFGSSSTSKIVGILGLLGNFSRQFYDELRVFSLSALDPYSNP
jgi:hypothetical protein